MINNTSKNDTQTTIENTTSKQESLNFVEWLNHKHKDRLDKARIRHPFMTTMRSSADNKVLSMFNYLPENNKPLSVFEEEKFKYTEPSFYHKIFYQIENYYKNNRHYIDSVKKNLKTFWNHMKNNHEKILNKINLSFEQIVTKEKDLREERFKEITQLNQSTFKNLFSKVYLKFNWNLKEKDQIKEIEAANREISRKLLINRWQNYWRQVCLIKNNYIIENTKVSNHIVAKNYETIFYKFWKISKSKIFGLSYEHKINTNIKNKFFKSAKIALVCLYFSMVNFRYNLYEKQKVCEIEEEELQADRILESVNDSSKIKESGLNPNTHKIMNIYDEDVDKLFFDIFQKEKEIRMKLENNSIQEKDLEDPLVSDAFTAYMHWQESGHYFNILKNSLLISYLAYCIIYKSLVKRQATVRKSFYKFIFYALISNEVFQYLSLIVFDGSKNSIATKCLDNDQARIMRYIFYKNNIDKAYNIE